MRQSVACAYKRHVHVRRRSSLRPFAACLPSPIDLKITDNPIHFVLCDATTVQAVLAARHSRSHTATTMHFRLAQLRNSPLREPINQRIKYENKQAKQQAGGSGLAHLCFRLHQFFQPGRVTGVAPEKISRLYLFFYPTFDLKLMARA